MIKLPPHIAWPLFIVALLSLSIVGTLITVYAARSDGGAQVVDDYYRKAVNWDAEVARQATSNALGWQVEISVDPVEGALRPVEIRVQDREGAPVTDLRGTVKAFRPQFTAAVAEIPLVPAPGAPGIYRQPFPIRQPGLWDFEILATRDTLRFQTKIRMAIENGTRGKAE